MGEKWTADGLSLDRIQRIEREADEGFAREPEAKAWDMLERIGKQADEAYAQELETKPTADEGPATSDIERVRRSLERIAQGPSPAPEQRAADARPRVRLSEHEELELKLDCHYEMIQEQSALITGQRAAIEELRGWIQECSDGVSNLGMRVAKLEDAVPSVGKPTMQEQESEAFYAGARQMSEALAEEDPSE